MKTSSSSAATAARGPGQEEAIPSAMPKSMPPEPKFAPPPPPSELVTRVATESKGEDVAVKVEGDGQGVSNIGAHGTPRVEEVPAGASEEGENKEKGEDVLKAEG